MNEDDQNNEDGSVWTSYSDMFTTMAIIFLVMFVFALLRSGVSTLSAIKEKKEKQDFIDGKISKKEIAKQNALNKKVEEEIEQMQQYSSIVDNKLKELNSFAKRMKAHKELMAKTLKQKQITQVALNKTREQLRTENTKRKRQNRELDNLKTHVERYQKNISSITISKNTLIQSKRNLEDKIKKERMKNLNIQQFNTKISKNLKDMTKSYLRESKSKKLLSQNLSKQQRINNEQESQIKNFIEDNKVKNRAISSLNSKITQLNNNNDQLNKNIEKQNISRIKQQKQLGALNKKIRKKQNEINFINKKISEVRNYSSGLQQEISNNQKKISSLNKEIMGLEGRLASRSSESLQQQKSFNKLKSSMGELKQYTSKLAKKLGTLEDENSALKSELENSYKALARSKSQNKRISRGIASVRNNIRSQIGQRIAAKLNASNLNAKVDPITGSVVLQMDEAFLFKRNNYNLSKRAKSTLQNLIPLYVDAIFSDKSMSKYIECVNIVGHASPTYGKQYSSPRSVSNQEAYNYNMELSTNRAKEIVKFIFSKEFGDFSNKVMFREKVSAIGRSFSEPVLRRPSSTNTECGEYDCKSSRRVEIKFTLKEDKQVWNKLESLN